MQKTWTNSRGRDGDRENIRSARFHNGPRLFRPVLLMIHLLALLWMGFPGTETSAGTLEGTITIKAVEKPRRPPRYYLGPRRSARETSGLEKASKDVVVFLEDLPGDQPITRPASNPRMLQQHGRFIPHVLPVLAGSTIEFPNQDNFYHNVFSVVAGDRFDLGRFGAGKSKEQQFDEPGVVVVRCEIHSGMKAYPDSFINCFS
jgi:hypothetical protein